MTFVMSLIDVGFHTLLAFGGIMAAGMVYFGPWSKFIPAGLRAVAAVVCLLTSAFAFGHLDGRSSFKTAIAEANVKLLEDQGRANEEISNRATADAIERGKYVADLREFNNNYARDLSDGKTTACPADDVYLERLHAVLQSAQPTPGTK